MNRFQKVLMTSLWGLTVLLMVIVAAGLQLKKQTRDSANADPANGVAVVQPDEPASGSLPKFFDAPTFSLIDQQNTPFASTDLKGKVWVSQFIFTTCQSICPMMMAKMAALQKTIDPRVQLISFSVDPKTDRPPVLLAKANSLGAQYPRWRFLTNPDGDKTSISNVVSGMFEAKPGPTDPQTMHSERFFLIDGNGKCRGVYSSTTPGSMQLLTQDAATVLAEKH
jgi:protein SCO1/2